MFENVQESLSYLINSFTEESKQGDSYLVSIKALDKIPLHHLDYLNKEFCLQIEIETDFIRCTYL